MGLLGSDVSLSVRHHRTSSALEVNDVALRAGLPRNISLRAPVPVFTMPRPMHGRLLTIPATLLMMAFAATPAPADQTLGIGQPADADGVVVGWQLTSGTAQSGIRLRSTQALGGGTATTATSDAVSTAPGQVIAARLPIAADGRLELVGATGSPAIQATVEPDADG